MANTFQPTGQLLTDHRAGRFTGGAEWSPNSVVVPANGGCAGRVIATAPHFGPVGRISVIARRSCDFLQLFAHQWAGVIARQLIEYDSDERAFP
jgi:hypothetical protein